MLLGLVLVHLISLVQETTASLAKPNCPETCGNITIPYPFGIGKGCYLDEPFEVKCNESLNSASIPYAGYDVLKISLDYVHIKTVAISNCSYYKSSESSLFEMGYSWGTGQPFRFSHTKNKLVAIGYDIFAYMIDRESGNLISECTSLGNNSVRVSVPFCFDNGCCQADISKDVTSFHLWVGRLHSFAHSWVSKPCTISFVADKDFSIFNFSTYTKPQEVNDIPVVLDWAIGNVSCQEARERADCICGSDSDCIHSTFGTGYRCNCSQGYRGNPYLPSGCQDIDECEELNNNPCQSGYRCINTPGNYTCDCPPGHDSIEVIKDGEIKYECKRIYGARFDLFTYGGIGIIAGALILYIICVCLYPELEERKKNRTKQKFFKRNGGLLLQQQISSSKGNVEKTKLYSKEDLEKATQKYNESRVLGKGGLGTVYKGMLSDGSIVAVKKSNIVDESQVGQFINEVIILSQINQRNIVKLLGCCLETEVPLLVYEYVSNGTLSHHLHGVSTISWNNRLRIAGEVAGALAYLHSYASTTIFHRDIKSSNILLDENYRAVVSDFGLSRSVPLDKTHLTTFVGGTFGYLDPEYFRSGQLSDKSDVYAFGVVLAELLTGEEALSSGRSNEGLVAHFRSSMKQDRLFEILEALVLNEGPKEEILCIAKLAKRCLKLNAKKRPSMKEVVAELDQLRRLQKQQSLQPNCQDDYYSVSDRSYSYTITNESQDIISTWM